MKKRISYWILALFTFLWALPAISNVKLIYRESIPLDRDTIDLSLYKTIGATKYLLKYSIINNNEVIKEYSRFFTRPIKFCFLADIDNDSDYEVCVGVEKTTRFDKSLKLRPFFFKILNNKLSAFWLGSKLGENLIKFKAVKINGKTFIETLEKLGRKRRYNISLFLQSGFGFQFFHSISKNIYSFKQALEIYKGNTNE